MSLVNLTTDGVSKSVIAGQVSQVSLVNKATAPIGVARISIPLLNQKFSAQDNVTIKGGEVIVSSLA
jgi:hypothetical protein